MGEMQHGVVEVDFGLPNCHCLHIMLRYWQQLNTMVGKLLQQQVFVSY